MSKTLITATITLLTFGLQAQETYWVANRASGDIMELSTWGSVLQRVAMPTSLRSAHVAPDGKVWVVRFIQSTVDIYDPVTAAMTSATCSLGSAYDIAFDNQGTAWISGGTGVENFDANGVSIQAYPLSNSAPLGITIDNNNNKWIAHRTSPGSVSRIDATGIVSNYPLPGSTTQPVRITADYRGVVGTSRMWITGDGPSELVEIDDQGNVLNVYALPITSTGGIGPVFDKNGHIWVGSFGSGGNLVEVDQTNGSVLNTYGLPPNILGLAVDSIGRILATARVTFSGVGPPCEVRRVDPATAPTAANPVEMNTLLTLAGSNAAGTQSAVSTPFAYSLVVAPFGDLDGDGEPNFVEATNGTFPRDACSNGNVSLHTTGSSNATTGGTVIWNVNLGAGIGFSAWALRRVPAGTGIVVPGASCEVLLDPVLFLGATFLTGSGTVTQTIPVDPGLIGVEFIGQALALAGSSVFVSNLSGVRLW